MEDAEVTGDAFHKMWKETERITDLCNPYVYSVREVLRKVEGLGRKIDSLIGEISLIWDPTALICNIH